MNQRLTIAIMAICAIIVGLLTYQLSKPRELKNSDLQSTILLPAPKPINFPGLLDHTGKDVSAERLKGHWSILFFAFTNCPDICPATMQVLKEVKQSVEQQHGWGNYQVVFVSVDPARDTVERLSSYVPHFDPQFLGLTGDINDISHLSRQLGIIFAAEEPDESGFYNVDHSASIILMNPQGQMAGVMSAPHRIDKMSSDLVTLAKHYSSDHQIILERAHLVKDQPDDTSESPKDANTVSTQGLLISDTWMRMPAPGVSSTAAYLSISNQTDQQINIVKVETEQFNRVMFHNTELEDGVAKMRHVDTLAIPANGQVSLEPNGLHMMLMGANDQFGLEQAFELVLIDDKGTRYPVTMKYRQP